jgi:predicted  nucleic acid-binding Zn-ribbon protein
LMMPGGGAATNGTRWRHTSFPQMDLECQDLQEYCRLLEDELERAREEARAVAAQRDGLQDALQEAHRELEQERVQVGAQSATR